MVNRRNGCFFYYARSCAAGNRSKDETFAKQYYVSFVAVGGLLAGVKLL